MPDLLGATNPVPNYDNTGYNRQMPSAAQAPDPRIQNVPDPGRINRADGRSERQGADNSLQSGALRYDSNLQVFLQQLRDAPDLAAVMGKALVWLRGIATTPGLAPGVAQELSQLLQFLQMDQEQFAQFFFNQMQAGNRFSGPIFSLLRQAYQSIPNEQLREAILSFARRYSDYSSTQHLTDSMMSLLRQMQDYLPKSWRGRLTELSGRLENGFAAGARAENLKLLQGEVLLYLGAYVERTHDMGRVRTMIGQLMLLTARYENGGEAELLAAFRQLSGYGDVLTGLNQLDDQAILRLLRENAFTRAVENDQFARQFAQTAARALQGQYGAEVRDGFQEIVRAMLIHESVYMPLNHAVIPMEWDGRLLYSELWVDPDAGDEGGRRDGYGDKIQFLFKLDVQPLGFLEMTLAAWKDQVDLAVYGPETLEANSRIIEEDLGQILADCGLSGQNIRVAQRERPLTLTEVFPDLFNGKRSVNVKI